MTDATEPVPSIVAVGDVNEVVPLKVTSAKFVRHGQGAQFFAKHAAFPSFWRSHQGWGTRRWKFNSCNHRSVGL